VIPKYVPMTPTLVSKPFHRDGWVYEEKVDGFRMLAYKDRGRTRLISRNDVDHTARNPELAATIDALPASSFVLDAELAIFDSQLRSRFEWLRHRPVDEVATLPVLIAFDPTLLSNHSANGGVALTPYLPPAADVASLRFAHAPALPYVYQTPLVEMSKWRNSTPPVASVDECCVF
jgi:hypothetical protein